MEYTHVVQSSKNSLVNTDPQRRCYNGCHYKSEIIRGPTVDHEYCRSLEHAEKRLKIWTELNDYAVSFRGGKAKVFYTIKEIHEEEK